PLDRNTSEYPVSKRIFFPSVWIRNERPGSAVKYRSIRVLLSARTVRLSRDIIDEDGSVRRIRLGFLPASWGYRGRKPPEWWRIPPFSWTPSAPTFIICPSDAGIVGMR